MNPELLTVAGGADKSKRAEEARKARGMAHACALHFLVFGADAHELRGCINTPPCSRDYDPEEAPHDTRLYEDTGIAALYGLPGGEAHVWQLAGWNVGRAK